MSTDTSKSPGKEDIRLIVRCTKDKDHAKVLRLGAGFGMARAQELAALLDGTSPLYIYAPEVGSVMGNCHVCRAKVTCEVKEVEANNVL